LYAAAHTVERHGADVPLSRAESPGGRSIEGRIYGDAPWSRSQNWSYKWKSNEIMNVEVNRYIRSNWKKIRSDLMRKEVHTATYQKGGVGEGYFNEGMYGTGARSAKYHHPQFVHIVIQLVPGNPPTWHVVTAYPAGIPKQPGL